MLTAVYLVGWILAIYWGYLMVVKAKTGEDPMKQLIYGANSDG